MDIKEILGEELFSQVTAKLGDKKLLLDDGKLIPKHRLDEVSESLKMQKEQNQGYKEQVEQLKKSASGNEELTKQITSLQSQMTEKETQFTAKELKTKKTFAIKEALLNAGVADADARDVLSYKFDIEKIELDEQGKPKGFEETIKPLKENNAFKGMFGQTKMAGNEHDNGKNPDLGEYAGDKNPFSKKGLNLQKQIEIHRKDTVLEQKLRASAL